MTFPELHVVGPDDLICTAQEISQTQIYAALENDNDFNNCMFYTACKAFYPCSTLCEWPHGKLNICHVIAESEKQKKKPISLLPLSYHDEILGNIHAQEDPFETQGGIPICLRGRKESHLVNNQGCYSRVWG
jgi:hypothetical protein